MTISTDEPGLYKWLVLLVCFMQQLLLSSVMSAVGVFYVIFIQNLGGSSSLISLASSICISVNFAIGKNTFWLLLLILVLIISNHYQEKVVVACDGDHVSSTDCTIVDSILFLITQIQ